jgi:MFS family permease
MDPHTSRRWYALATVSAAQFLAVADAFIVNVAIPAIRTDLHASGAAIEAIIAVYQITYAALVITGGRLGDIFGRKPIFLLGVLGFTLASLWCGLAPSAAILILARCVQGATAALMVPQVLASIHTLFPDAARARAFAIFGLAIGLGAAAGFMAGGWLVTLDLAGMGWRAIFCVNVPIGLAILGAGAALMPALPRVADTRLDVPGTAVLLLGLLGLIVPLMLGREFGWPWWCWLMIAAGIAALAGFLRLERSVANPLIDLTLLDDRVFVFGMAATACFFLGNLSFYFVLTLYMQNGLGFSAFNAALTVLPLSFAFVIGTRLSGGRLIEGCLVQALGLAAIAAVIATIAQPTMWMLMAALVVFGYGQGMVLAPLFSAVLTNVRHAHAGSGAGILTTTQQIANGTGVVIVGAIYLSVHTLYGDRAAMLTSLAVLAAAIAGTIVALATCGSAARSPALGTRSGSPAE